ncbi:hypothetical protein KDH_03510 [Dictyobacter sp. S3.2.2.5]|uniref:Peptide chain release factor 3 n=1 Tax=Dictyobacter halimunensis TaxID=3026934 RepID=A0ABQ6FKG5_9CHLR|nr:hypothetical protein KDH_03510 [Dictyobacter sp. S3.2.2.5]
MQIPSRFEVKTLMEEHYDPCISLFMPVEQVGPETQQNPVRLRNQLREIEKQLEQHTQFASIKDELLKPLSKLPDDHEFWLEPGQGMAIFRSLEQFHCYRLPERVKEQQVISSHFYLKPLLSFLANDGRFYVLALSQNEIRLLEGTRYTIQDVLLPEQVPESLAATLQYEQPEKELQYHSTGSGALVGKSGRHTLVFHGKGESDEAKEQLTRYFQQINHGLRELLHDETVPMVLAGVEYLTALYRKANTYPHLLENSLAGNPDELSPQELHQKTLSLVGPVLERGQQEALAQYQENSGTEMASNNITLVVPAAHEGRIASLFIARDREQWGRFNPLTEAMEVHETAMPGDDDLLERAATQCVLHGGAVYILDQPDAIGGQLAAAVFRY